MFLKLRQVFFEKDQKLDEHCIPYDCTGNDPELDIEVLSEGFRKQTEIIDTREVSKRYDDILLVWKK